MEIMVQTGLERRPGEGLSVTLAGARVSVGFKRVDTGTRSRDTAREGAASVPTARYAPHLDLDNILRAAAAALAAPGGRENGPPLPRAPGTSWRAYPGFCRQSVLPDVHAVRPASTNARNVNQRRREKSISIPSQKRPDPRISPAQRVQGNSQAKRWS